MREKLADAMFRIFPEVGEFVTEGDENLPYVLMAYLAEFLESQAEPVIPDGIIRRVMEFNSWCQRQPRGDDAGNDIFTILVVGLYEAVIERRKLRPLLPKLIPKLDMERGREYWISWVGKMNYEEAIKLFPPVRRGRMSKGKGRNA